MSERECTDMCEMCYPEKMDVDDFIYQLTKDIDNFKANMKNLGITEKYAEEWMKTFTAWKELE